MCRTNTKSSDEWGLWQRCKLATWWDEGLEEDRPILRSTKGLTYGFYQNYENRFRIQDNVISHMACCKTNRTAWLLRPGAFQWLQHLQDGILTSGYGCFHFQQLTRASSILNFLVHHMWETICPWVFVFLFERVTLATTRIDLKNSY